MQIGFDAKRLFNNYTGLGNYSRTTLDILCRYVPEHAYLLFTPRVQHNAVTERFLVPGAATEVVVPTGLVKGSLWRTVGMGRSLSEHHVDLYHGLSNELPTGLRRRGIRSVVTIHDVAFRTFTDMYNWHDRQIYDLKWRYACTHADHIVAISESTKRDILRFYEVDESKVHVIYQPVQPLYYEPPIAEGRQLAESAVPDLPQHYMLYVGSINSRKNLLGIVKAMELLPSDLQLPLVVVGDGGDYRRQVERYIAAHNLQHLFLFPKSIRDNQTLKALYQCATLFVYPSFYEGFGLPVVEALLTGCPVVTSNVSSLPEAGGPFAGQADPNDPASIAHHMQLLLAAGDERRQEVIDGGRGYARRLFDPATLARQLAAIYEGGAST